MFALIGYSGDSRNGSGKEVKNHRSGKIVPRMSSEPLRNIDFSYRGTFVSAFVIFYFFSTSVLAISGIPYYISMIRSQTSNMRWTHRDLYFLLFQIHFFFKLIMFQFFVLTKFFKRILITKTQRDKSSQFHFWV